jgi:nucleotide-binding universal stress UspA family protein
MFKKILVPIDGSKHSSKALIAALDIAEKFSAKIKLISVAQPYIIPTGTFYPLQPILGTTNIASYSKKIEKVHERMLLDGLKKAKELKPDLVISKKLATGKPADKIVAFASEENFDLIVMGSRGIGEIQEFFLGSVSHSVANHANCPVLIIK